MPALLTRVRPFVTVPRELAARFALALLVAALCSIMPGTMLGKAPRPAAEARRGRGILGVRVSTKGTRRPIAGAEIQMTLRAEGALPLVLRARTRSDGVARFERLLDGVAHVRVTAPGLAREIAVAHVRHGRGWADVELAPGGSLAGVIVGEDGTPVAGAVLQIRPDDDDRVEPWVATTARDGTFRVESLRRGLQRIDVAADGYEPTSRRAVPARTGAARDTGALRIVIRRTGTVLVTVFDMHGLPARGATVVIAGSGVWPPREIPADGQGRARIQDVPGGVYELRASRNEEVADPYEGLMLDPGAEASITLRLAPGVTLVGTVLDAETETPIEGAEITIAEDALSFAPKAARTDALGQFRIVGLRPMPHRLSVQAPTYVARIGEQHTPTPEPFVVKLRRAAVLSGTVVDELDRPVAGVQLEVVGTQEDGTPVQLTGAATTFRAALFAAQLAGPQPLQQAGELGVTIGAVPPIPRVPSMMFAEDAQSGTDTMAVAGGAFVSDAEGNFRIEGVPPGRIQIVARHPAYAPGMTQERLVAAGATVEGIRVVVPAGGEIDGRVVDGRGYPVGSVRVELSAEREAYPRMTLAAEDGSFRFMGALGIVTLTAYPNAAPAARARVEVRSNVIVQVTLVLEGDALTVEGRTVDERGFPIGGATVRVRSLRARSPVTQMATSADDGTFSLVGLPAPPYAIEADHPSYATTRLPRVERIDRDFRITLVQGAAVVGAVADGYTDAPLPQARLELTSSAGRVLRARADAEGKFSIPRVAAGQYTLSVSADGFIAERRRIQLDARSLGVEDLDIGTIELQPGGSLSGEVVDALGAPVSGAEVAWGEPAAWATAVRTDPQGRFTLRGVRPGDVMVSARHPGAGEGQSRHPSRVIAAEDTPGVVVRLPERLDPDRAATGGGMRTGVAATVRTGAEGVEVSSVVRGSRADAAGLRTGDVVVSIDDEPVTVAARARQLLRGADGVEAIVEIRRGSVVYRLVVPREQYSE